MKQIVYWVHGYPFLSARNQKKLARLNCTTEREFLNKISTTQKNKYLRYKQLSDNDFSHRIKQLHDTLTPQEYRLLVRQRPLIKNIIPNSFLDIILYVNRQNKIAVYSIQENGYFEYFDSFNKKVMYNLHDDRDEHHKRIFYEIFGISKQLTRNGLSHKNNITSTQVKGEIECIINFTHKSFQFSLTEDCLLRVEPIRNLIVTVMTLEWLR